MAEGIAELTESTFAEEIGSSELPVLVDFWAEWCGPCKMVAPVLEEIGAEHSQQIKIAKLDVDASPTIARQYNVMSIPTMIVFKDGVESPSHRRGKGQSATGAGDRRLPVAWGRAAGLEPAPPPKVVPMKFAELDRGDAGPQVDELHRRLQSLGFLDGAPADSFCDLTQSAVSAFQQSRGLEPDGVCTVQTWKALIEAEHQFGDRPLYLTSPMMRGDDVAALQLRLGTLGFNAGRVDGYFGPNTQRALRDFQRNVDLVVDGVCARDTVTQLSRMASRGTTISIAGLREREALRGTAPTLSGLRIAICHQLDDALLAGSIGADLHAQRAIVAISADTDWSALATLTNQFDADVCLALETVDDHALDVAYFGTDGFESLAGRALAEQLLRQFPHGSGWSVGAARPMRLPILRETRCPHRTPPARSPRRRE